GGGGFDKNDNQEGKNNPNDQIQQTNNDKKDNNRDPIDPNDRQSTNNDRGQNNDGPKNSDSKADAKPVGNNDLRNTKPGTSPSGKPDKVNPNDNGATAHGTLPNMRPGPGLNGSSGVFGNVSFGGGGQFGQYGQLGMGGANGFGGANGNYLFNTVVPQNGQVA